MIDIQAPPFHVSHLGEQESTPPRARLEVRYPFTGEVVGSVPRLTVDDVARALTEAANAPRTLSRYERSRILLGAAARIERDAEQVARLITWESGLCRKDTRHEVKRTLDVLRFSAAEALRDDGQCFAFDVSPNGRARRGYTVREPVRVVAAITPFNHPLNQVAHKVAPAVAAGAAMVLKPSDKTPLSAVYMATVLAEEGLPKGLFSVVTGEPAEIGNVFVSHPDVELVSFTGGVEVGKRIAASAGYRRTLLELGGNDPLLVLDDADLDEAARLAATGAFANSGQRCTAVKRIIAMEGIADALAERLVALAAGWRVGDPHDDATDIGTVIDERTAIDLEARANRTIEEGAKLLFGNERKGALYSPTVLDFVPATAHSVQTETFGPHAPIIRVKSVDEAITVANGTRYGLSAGVCTRDLERALRCIRELRCGTVNVGEVPGLRTEATPFGGTKDSGIGVKEGVVEAMHAMTFTKLYTLPWG